MKFIDRFKEEIACIRQRDPAAPQSKFIGTLQIILTYPGLQAVGFYRLANWFWRRQWYLIANFIAYMARFITLIEIHPGATIGRRFFIDHGAGVVIGETTEIADDCTIYQGVTLGGTSLLPEKRHPTLHSGVIVGAGAKILGPLEIGEDARVGSNSVVLNDVPESTTVVGIPAKAVGLDKISRKKMADKLEFEAYGVAYDHPNPEFEAISLLADRLNKLEKQIKLASVKKSSPAKTKTLTKTTTQAKDQSKNKAKDSQ